MPVPSILCKDPSVERGQIRIAIVHLAITLWLSLGALSAYGQTSILSPAMVGAAKPTAHRSGPSEEDDAAGKIRSLLKAAQSELDRVAASPAAALDAPPGTPPGQLLRRQALLRQLIRTYEQQIDDMAALTSLGEQRASLHDHLGQWRVDDTRLAYSMLAVEALRARVQANLRKIDMIKLGLAALDSQQEFAFETSKQLDESARQLLEKIEKRSGEVEKFIWERNLYLQQGQVAAAYIEAHKIRRKLYEEELSQANDELDYLQAQLKITEGKVLFSEADRNTLLGNLDTRMKALEAEWEKALGNAAEARVNLSAAESQLNGGGSRPAGKRGAGQSLHPRDPVAREFELAKQKLDTANAHANMLRLLLASIEMQRSVWVNWYDIAQNRDGNTGHRLSAVLDGLRDTVMKLYASADASYRFNLQQMTELERKIIANPIAEDADFLKMKAALMRERKEYHARLLGELLSTKDLLDRWNTQFVDDAGHTHDALSLDAWKRNAAYLAESIWSFELFTAEDTVTVGSKTISTTRSITLGKIISAVLILVVGLALGRALINGFCKFSVRYLKTAKNETMLAGKWFFALLFVVLFLMSLTTVKIPFTVFAFLGGAIAIGIGFGMQTLFKNLISGLMILIERPFRLGDVIEVGDIRGKVVDINLRSSLIRDRDEIETLVPNSTFIEQEVTNWTYSSKRVRFTLTVGVAYGSPTREVRELLLDTAKRHKLILEDPAPEVFFEDFAADSLAFSLQYWLDLSGGLDLRRVASDMRFMLDKAFTDAGIVIAFPQRDVHLDVGQAIPVRIVGAD